MNELNGNEVLISKYPEKKINDDVDLNIQREFEGGMNNNYFYQKALLITKRLSIFKLLYHLSGKKELSLMLLGTLGSILSAISGPIMSYNFGGAINNFSDIQSVDINDPLY